MFPDLDTAFPDLDTPTDYPPQQVEALGHLAPHEPDPPVRVPSAAGGLDPPLQVALPQADPQSHPPARGDGGPAAGLPRSRVLCFVLSSAPLDHQLHGPQVLAGVFVAAIANT